MPENPPDADEPAVLLRGASTRDALRVIGARIVSMSVSILAILLFYAFLPVDLGSGLWVQVLAVLIAVSLVAVSFVRQVRQIRRSPYPVLRAVEALVVLLAMLLAVAALGAYALALDDQNAFSEPMTRLDAFYFSVTTLATVGYGDITPASEAARLYAIVQMLVNLAFVGVVIKVISAVASREAKARHRG